MNRNKLPIIVLLTVLVFFYLPIMVLVIESFNPARFPGQWNGFSLKWYIKLFHERDLWAAFNRSIIIALSASAAATVIGTTCAIALHWFKTRLQKAHFIMTYLPIAMPDILMGLSLLMFFVAIGMKLGMLTVFIAHVTFCISYVARVVFARLEDFDNSLIEAAMDLGCTWRKAIWKVAVPILTPGILSGALLAFTLSIDDFVVTFFVAGPGTTTLPILMYSMIKRGATPLINALSTILLCITFACVFFSQYPLIKKERS
jgi:spermidine/putrescine transport system permease protein